MTLIEELAETKSKLALAEAATVAARHESAELVTAKETASNLALEISTLQTNLAAANIAKDSAIAAQVTAEKALADGKAELDLEANKKAMAIVAGQGGPVVRLDSDSQNQNSMQEMSREEFAKMPAFDQMSFVKNGGKLK